MGTRPRLSLFLMCMYMYVPPKGPMRAEVSHADVPSGYQNYSSVSGPIQPSGAIGCLC